MGEFYFDVKTKQVTEGREGSWENRMGPYETREEAERALEKARERTSAADAAEAADDQW